MYESIRRLDLTDVLWIYNYTSDAFENIKNIHSKSLHSIQGEVFTYLRTKANGPGSSEAVRKLFTGKIKIFQGRVNKHYHHKDTELLTKMYNSILRKTLGDTDYTKSDPLSELEQSLISIQATAKRAEEISERSAKLREQLESVGKLLDNNLIGEEQ